MPVPLDCPGPEHWQALFGDGVPADQRAGFERHLESCPACQERLDRTPEGGERLVRLVRQLGDPTTLRSDPALTQVLDRLHGAKPAPRPAAAEPPDLYFLTPSDQPGMLGTLGGYEVRSVVGQGGMGVVLKAYEPALHRLVAIKVLAPALAGSATARRRFTREAQAAAAVCHDHVVAVHGVDAASGLPYLVMQYVAGESLQDRLDRDGPLEVVEAVRVGLQTAAGLAAAHAQGLIHRDIKPANLLLEDGLARVKITDFGLARMADDVGLTQHGVVAGTPEYMAPEQARGEPIDHRADLFSLGSVLYAMCTGRPPFRGSTALAVLRQVSDADPPPVRTLNSDVPAWLEAVIARLLAKAPADRFQSAAEVAELLEGFLAHLRQPNTVPAPQLRPGNQETRRPRVRTWLTRLIPFGSLAALVVCLLVCLLVALAARPGESPDAVPEFYHDFRGGQSLPATLSLTGPDAEAVTRFEREGLRITLPAGREKTQAVGVKTNVPLVGDFEITASFEVLAADEPLGTPGRKFGTGVNLLIGPEPRLSKMAKVSFFRLPQEGTGFLADLSVRGPVREYKYEWEPTSARAGQLRFVRIGAVLHYLVAAAPEQDFQEIYQADYGAEDVRVIRLVANTADTPVAVDARLVDLRIRSRGLPADVVTGSSAGPARSRGKVAVALGGVLSLLIALALTLVFQGRPRPPVAAGRTDTRTANRRPQRRTVLAGTVLLVLFALALGWSLRPTAVRPRPSFLDVPLGSAPVAGVEEAGFHYQEEEGGQPFRWTDGHARLEVPLDPRRPPQALALVLHAYRTAPAKQAALTVLINGRTLFEGPIPLGAWERTFDLRDLSLGERAVIELHSDTFVPLGNRRGNGQGVSDDARPLGVQVRGLRLLATADARLPSPDDSPR